MTPSFAFGIGLPHRGCHQTRPAPPSWLPLSIHPSRAHTGRLTGCPSHLRCEGERSYQARLPPAPNPGAAERDLKPRHEFLLRQLKRAAQRLCVRHALRPGEFFVRHRPDVRILHRRGVDLGVGHRVV